ncbi:MAG: NAD(P)H-binding protein [Gemmatimonadaceae bacterium]
MKNWNVPQYTLWFHPRAKGVMILVVGATGLLGRSICKRLRDSGRDVRGLVREGSPGRPGLEKMGVQIFAGDLRTPADVDNACRGATTVISTATTMATRTSRSRCERSIATVSSHSSPRRAGTRSSTSRSFPHRRI